MVKGSSLKVLKTLMMVFNLVFLLIGVAILAVGIAVTVKFSHFTPVIGAGYNVAPIIIIVTGVIISLLSFFGCCGSVTENRTLLQLFAFSMLILLILQLVCAILGFVYKNSVKDQVREIFKASFDKYQADSDSTSFIDYAQKTLKCCGNDGADDFEQLFNRTAPDSCCIKTDCVPDTKGETYYSTGCSDAFFSFMQSNLALIGGSALGVCFIQLLGITFACLLSKNIYEYERV